MPKKNSALTVSEECSFFQNGHSKIQIINPEVFLKYTLHDDDIQFMVVKYTIQEMGSIIDKEFWTSTPLLVQFVCTHLCWLP